VDTRRRDRTGIALAGAVLAELVAIALYSFSGEPAAAAPAGSDALVNVNEVGRLLYIDYLVPFEVASILLLVAMVGAIILARRDS
jgi:NADH-quinone oxidoreductase subunit J